ncbi:hypothetical protein D6C83_08452 [Aureobasidium pullulans]|uniref:Uncharacterized protein n=1 Tax=Aureobasidium pullulans TaxID=5580 RepID=A0A4T0A0H7_AURPU|nr:hypothetical protein D6C83_08452 [Aureobasidium pullulans]
MATLHLETIKIELGISDDVHVVYLKSRQSNIALPNVGHERQFGLKSLGEALVATQGTHLNVVALSYTGLTTDIGSLRSWCSQVAKQVESFSISEGITSSATTFCMSPLVFRGACLFERHYTTQAMLGIGRRP